MSNRIAGVVFILVAVAAFGDRLGYFILSPEVYVALVLMGIGAIVLMGAVDRGPKD